MKKIVDFLFVRGLMLVIVVFLLGTYNLFIGNTDLGVILLVFYPLFHYMLMEIIDLNSKIKK